MKSSRSSTSSLILNTKSFSSPPESNTPCHPYNTRSSAKLRSSFFKNLSTVQLRKGDTDLSVFDLKDMPRRHSEYLPPAVNDQSCRVKICKYFLCFTSIVCLVVTCTYLVQYLQTRNTDSYQFFSHELNIIKAEMAKMKNEVQDAFGSKDDTDKKLEVIEELLRELKKSTQKTQDSATRCPAREPPKPKIVRKEIAEALNLYDDDKTGKIDFASELTGGRILSVRNTQEYPAPENVKFLGVTICSRPSSASAILQPGALPGECWAFQGSKGSAIIQLMGYVIISGVSLEHILQHMSPTGDVTTAPRDFRIGGMESENDEKSKELGKFTYDINGPRIQYFHIGSCEKPYSIIEFSVLSNHGHEEFTCVYRLRVHGVLSKQY